MADVKGTIARPDGLDIGPAADKAFGRTRRAVRALGSAAFAERYGGYRWAA
ncbi:hypothetical protein [Streptomyces lushanensis]|uniref:hypothetical protein n=1 Tax=Streptomyces lushanensis TaxID=1434255 RepID=UPI001475F260|nr:hypothetical protein [Streptomyces lushanensis]